jgi:hypothetical protein
MHIRESRVASDPHGVELGVCPSWRGVSSRRSLVRRWKFQRRRLSPGHGVAALAPLLLASSSLFGQTDEPVALLYQLFRGIR